TLTELRQALPAFDTTPECIARLELPAEKVRPFLAIGFGYLIVEHLFDAMQHEHMLATGDFWADVQAAALCVGQASSLPDNDGRQDACPTFRDHLQAAADKLLAAREVMYTATIHLLDVVLPDPKKLADSLPKSFLESPALNLIASGQLLERI